MRKALIVGIDYYEAAGMSDLNGAVNDAHSLKAVLDRHADGTVNFDAKLLTGTGPADKVLRSELKDNIEELFKGDSDIALFYFAGHGVVTSTGGYILTTESKRADEGVSLSELLDLANKSKAKNKIILLDSCQSGIVGSSAIAENKAVLSEGLTVLTASTDDQYASEENGQGVFTGLLIDALNGSAANLVGDISPGSVYAHIDQSLGAWEQRPVFKTNVKTFVSLRKVQAPVQLDELQKLKTYFPNPGFEFKLDPTYEPESNGRDVGMPKPIDEHTEIFAVLQRYNRLNLLVPVDAPHMWHAAMESKSCKLTLLGQHYWRLVNKGRI